jgi:polyhydroxyalkanoate synthesis regulator phasin
MKRKILVTVVIVGLLVAGGLFLALNNHSVQAASGSSTMANTALNFGRGQVDPEDLAEALGMSVEELTEAKAIAVANTIDQALELGLITQEEADELMSEETSSRRGLYKLLSTEERNQLDYDVFLFEALGITEEEYKTAIETIRQANLDEAVAEGTLTQEEADAIVGQRALMDSAKFNESIKDAYEDAIAEALEDGTITQAQADALLAKLDKANIIIFNAQMGHGDGPRLGGRPSRMHEDLTSDDREKLDDVDR